MRGMLSVQQLISIQAIRKMDRSGKKYESFGVKLRSPCEFFRCVLQQSGFQPALVCRTQCIMTPAR